VVFSAVMQAPIGPASTPELVSTVCAAGGLGTLAASWTPPSRLRAQIHELQRLTDAPFCVNLVLAFDQRERLEILIEEHVAFVSFSWGVDSQSIAYAKDAGLSVLVQVGEPEAGIQAVAAGADGLIAQGTEAGGHVEATTTVTRLVGTLSRKVSVPVIAAGGIAEPSSVSAAMRAGASGVAAGTSYLACPQADVHPDYLAAVLRAATSDSVLTGLFDIGWPDAPHRVLRNDTLDRWETAGRPLPGRRPGEGQVIASRRGRPVVRYSDEQPTRHTEGDIESMALYAGTSVGAVHRIDDAAAITERLLAATAAI
jgi:NAD(P)H-dependent flavin oxidoreductase YrpB (nitropropane dioxygenase family)